MKWGALGIAAAWAGLLVAEHLQHKYDAQHEEEQPKDTQHKDTHELACTYH